MTTTNSQNSQYTNNADGYTLGGGTTVRSLTLTGGNVTVTGAGSNTYTMPAASDTLVGRASSDTLTNKTISTASNTVTGISNANLGSTAGDLGGAASAWTPTLVGFSSNPTGIYRYTLVGKICTLFIVQLTNGTSNSTAFTISLPFTAATVTNMMWTSVGQIVNNGSSSFGLIQVNSAGTVLNLYADAGGNVFVASGNKRTLGLQITYETV